MAVLQRSDRPSGPRWRRLVIHLLKQKRWGVPAAVAARALGATCQARKLSVLCGYVPSTVEVPPPEWLAGGRGFVMDGAGGLDPVARSLAWGGWEGYERPFPDLFAACCRGARRVLDVGSFSGLYSLIAAANESAAEVFAFEPYPHARALLDANLERNRWRARVHIVPMAASDHAGEAELYVPTTRTGLLESASSLNAAIYAETMDRIRVPLITLDGVLADRAPGRVDLIKIDVETHEPQVLRGAGRILHEDRPVIFLEVLPTVDHAVLDAIRTEASYLDGVLMEDSVRWLDAVRYVDGRNDHVFCPREKQDWFRDRVESAGCRLLGLTD